MNLIVDKMTDQCFSHRDELDSTVQIGTVCSTRTCIACMNVCMLYIALASFIYTRDYVRQKNA